MTGLLRLVKSRRSRRSSRARPRASQSGVRQPFPRYSAGPSAFALERPGGAAEGHRLLGQRRPALFEDVEHATAGSNAHRAAEGERGDRGLAQRTSATRAHLGTLIQMSPRTTLPWQHPREPRPICFARRTSGATGLAAALAGCQPRRCGPRQLVKL